MGYRNNFLSTLSLRIFYYPRSPCGERLSFCIAVRSTFVDLVFLSTLSLRRATSLILITFCYFFPYFYPRSPCGETTGSPCGVDKISTVKIFLSTLSLRRATATCCFRSSRYPEHADRFLSTLSLRRHFDLSFAARHPIHALLAVLVFLSTLSLRRATAKVHKTVGHFCAYETNFMGIASSC